MSPLVNRPIMKALAWRYMVQAPTREWHLKSTYSRERDEEVFGSYRSVPPPRRPYERRAAAALARRAQLNNPISVSTRHGNNSHATSRMPPYTTRTVSVQKASHTTGQLVLPHTESIIQCRYYGIVQVNNHLGCLPQATRINRMVGNANLGIIQAIMACMATVMLASSVW